MNDVANLPLGSGTLEVREANDVFEHLGAHFVQGARFDSFGRLLLKLKEYDAKVNTTPLITCGSTPARVNRLCVTPHLIGACNPHWDPRASAAVVGLTSAADLFHFYKGILEGIACEFALNAAALQDAAGIFAAVRITGGGAESIHGVRLRAALSGKTLETLQNQEAVCLGAAILAGVAAGVYRDAAEGAAQTVKVNAAYAPEPELAKAYSSQLRRYNRLYPALAPLFGTE
jgi:xylulokinase